MTYDRAKLVVELVRDEDERLRVYRCTSNKLSIGVGRNLDDVGIRPIEVKQLAISVASCIANGITREQSRVLLANDIDAAEADLDRELPWWRTLDPVRQRVLLNMCFNMGIGRRPNPKRNIKGKGLLGFFGTLPMIEHHDFAGAAKGMRASAWHDQVGARATRLEAMMATGKDPS